MLTKEEKLKCIQNSINKWEGFKKEVEAKTIKEPGWYFKNYWEQCGFCIINSENDMIDEEEEEQEVYICNFSTCLLNQDVLEAYCRPYITTSNVAASAISAADQGDFRDATRACFQLLERMYVIKKEIEELEETDRHMFGQEEDR